MQELIPITLFICFAYAIQAVVDARARTKLVAPHISGEVIASLVQAEQFRARYASLRWGITLVTASIGMFAVRALGWEDLDPGVVAVLLGALGVGQVAYFLMVARLGKSGA